MTKFLKTVQTGFTTTLKAISDQWFYVIGLTWMFASFLYIGEPQFWVVLGFAILFTGVQNLINEIKLNSKN